jgi:hypothetical protein
MAHFYDCKDRKKPQLITEVTTPAQARKHGKKTYPSITTIIGQTIKDPFLDGIHKPRSMVKYARMEEHWNKEWKEIEQLCYGLVESPDGRTISSAEFGTSVHEAIEKKLWTLKFGGQFEGSICRTFYRLGRRKLLLHCRSRTQDSRQLNQKLWLNRCDTQRHGNKSNVYL